MKGLDVTVIEQVARLSMMAEALDTYATPDANGLGRIGCRSFADAMREVSQALNDSAVAAIRTGSWRER